MGEIAIFERKFRSYDPDMDSTYWTSDVRLAIFSDSGVVWDTAEEPARLWTLLKVARESAADIDSIFEDLLDKKKTKTPDDAS